ncbi:MAG: bifunctional glutamate N-acetyltransferase/amino-acid acetyltransferase ArgJ [Spirochaetes bacterium]|nr:bifunctional glutamate N-acetyltransferase/amino-acid acetyltransferase ArgJ [Spirochaetota bacterium]
MKSNITAIKNPQIENVKGFHSNGVHCGLKNEKKLDLGVVYSDTPADTIALYTSNKFQAAPLKVCQKHLLDNIAQLLVVNTKHANACTGEEGINNAELICEEAANLFNVKQIDVIPMSTGVIGEQLPMKKITEGLKLLKPVINEKNDCNFAKAIMTTDTYFKIYGVKVKINDIEYSIIGTCKGAGMISPNMATMLCFVFTDAVISKELLKIAFINSINKSFNAITVDGDMSTNDTAIIFANGHAENKKIDSSGSKEYTDFCDALDEVTLNLAKSVVKDGEGATKLIEISVHNAKTTNDAKLICTAIANSNLVKTAFFGEDPNWGRIICAIGFSGSIYNPKDVSLSIEDIAVYNNGEMQNHNAESLKKAFQKKEIKIKVDLNIGDKNWTMWTCDLSYDYIKINASYTT